MDHTALKRVNAVLLLLFNHSTVPLEQNGGTKTISETFLTSIVFQNA